jgi:FkbM family methyltransferase
MPNLRSLLKGALPSGARNAVQRLLLGYHSFAPSFSSAGEDMILRHLVGSDKRDGFYVDVGAFDPVRASNTCFFHLNGWRGINIDARPGSMRAFDRLRPADVNLEVGIAAERGELTYYIVDEGSSMNSFSLDFLKSIGMAGEVKRTVSVPVLPLAEVLERHLPAGQKIDFMTVDVEGYDYRVLSSNDWRRFRPGIVVVEDECVEGAGSEVTRLMEGCGYRVCAQNVILMGKINEYFFIDEALSNGHR